MKQDVVVYREPAKPLRYSRLYLFINKYPGGRPWPREESKYTFFFYFNTFSKQSLYAEMVKGSLKAVLRQFLEVSIIANTLPSSLTGELTGSITGASAVLYFD